MDTEFSPADFFSSCACLALRRAARGVARRYDEALRPVDLNNGQFSMLTAIGGLGEARLPAIARLLGMDRTTVTAALKPLVRRGLVRITAASDDARERQARLTEAGESLLARAVPLWRAAQDDVSARLGSIEDRARLRQQLDRLD